MIIYKSQHRKIFSLLNYHVFVPVLQHFVSHNDCSDPLVVGIRPVPPVGHSNAVWVVNSFHFVIAVAISSIGIMTGNKDENIMWLFSALLSVSSTGLWYGKSFRVSAYIFCISILFYVYTRAWCDPCWALVIGDANPLWTPCDECGLHRRKGNLFWNQNCEPKLYFCK